ncbi:MAG: hypothetical protein Q7U14_12085, partial [Lacisediminimonas sp.]|nr:hypothetical protein [Lacisediminimonas sp.]
MLNPNWQRSLLGLSLCLALLPAQACGPEFPLRLLNDRAQTLNELPESNFAFELSRIAPAPYAAATPLQAATEYWRDDYQNLGEQREQTEQSQLPPAQAELIAQLRQLTDARQAERLGAALPGELRLYTAGAVAFAQGEDALAAEYFQRLLTLPAAERPLRSTWAAYSLARLHTYASFPAQSDYAEPDVEAAPLAPEAAAIARTNLQRVRELADAGFDDPL